MKRYPIIGILIGALMWAFIFLLCCSGCITRKACSRKFPPEIISSDSLKIETKVIYRDTIIEIPGQTVYDTIEIKAECDSLGKAHILPFASIKRSGRAHSVTMISGNKIIQACSCDREKKIIQGLIKETNVLRESKKTAAEKIIEYETPWYIWLLIGAMALTIFYLLIKNLF